MKNKRLSVITEIISSRNISTQEELIDALQHHGFEVTQATISRDIKSLRLTKMADEHGRLRYVIPASILSEENEEKYKTIFRESVISAAVAGNLLVIKCFTGMGNAACASLDLMVQHDIIGTIAGDDTIFCAMESEASARKLLEKLRDSL